MWRRRWLTRWWPRAKRAPGAGRSPVAALPQATTVRSRHVWITADRNGFVVRRRTGLTGWMPICDLRWDDIVDMELDTGTHDSARVLYASTRTSRIRRPLIDQAHLTAEQWVYLRDSVAGWTAQGVRIDLAHLTVSERRFGEL